MAGHAGAQEETTVLVTGISGYLAQHVAKVLLEAGYRVRGTLRDRRREDELRGLFGPLGTRLECTQADLLQDTNWERAMQGCRYVQHVASPFPAQLPKDEAELIAPAREGTLRVLRAAAAARVQRVVLTSSIAAIMFGHADRFARTFTEADWSVSERCVPYQKSKTMAERAAWDFVNTLAEDQPMELVTINPGLILGPLLGADASTSGELVRKLLTREIPAIIPLSYAAVDVRDVAAAHLAAMRVPEAAGQRFLCATEATSMSQVAAILRRHYPERRIPSLTLPAWLARGLARFDATLRLVYDDIGEVQRFDNTRIRNVLGFQPRELEETVLATAQSYIARGLA